MNDKTVINTISKIYFIIVSFISFILLTLSLVFIILQNGLELHNVSAPNVKIKQLYIKWNEKLNISIKDIQITKSSNQNSELNYKKINKLFIEASLFKNWIENIDIERLSFNDLNSSLSFNSTKGGFFKAQSPSMSLQSKISIEKEFLKVTLEELVISKKDISIKGDIFLNENMNISTDLNTEIKSNLINLKAHANKNTLYYIIDSKKKIKSLQNIVTAFNLPKNLHFWLLDAIDMSHLTINNLHGWIAYNNLGDAYKNVYANLHLHNLNYTYDTKLDAIHTKYTELIYKKGVLYINPKEAYSYKQNLGTSKLNIDFNPENVILTLYLTFDGMLNKDMLGILKHYKINVPFLQKQGEIKSNLKLTINLNTIDIEAKGDFFTKKANFDYYDLNIDLFDTYMKLDNYDIRITEMFAKYKDIATANVSADFNAKDSIGTINFDLESIEIPDMNLSLGEKPLKVTYNIYPKNDSIDIDKSSWKLFEEKLEFEKLHLPFNLDTLDLTIPKTSIEIQNIAKLHTSGNINLKGEKSKLDVTVSKFKYKNINLATKDTNLSLIYDNALSIKNLSQTLFLINETKMQFNKTSALLNGNSFRINSNLKIDNDLKTNLELVYALHQNKGHIHLADTSIHNNNHKIFATQEKLHFTFDYLNDELNIKSKKLDLHFILAQDSWMFNLNSLEKIVPYSNVLQKYDVTNGNLNVYKKNDENHIYFKSSLNYPHKVLVTGNEPIDLYKINGDIDTKSNKLTANINNLVNLKVDETINISVKNAGIDINEIVNALDNNESSTKPNNIDLQMTAKNSFLYIGKNRRALSDNIEVKYKDDILTAELTHAKANAIFKYTKNSFQLYGDNFNDKFMGKLFALSKFKGGRFDFSLSGTLQKYNGVFHINNTTIKSYKILNNILAFINTIPSLVTFSLPGYNKHGLKVKNAYMKFSAQDDNFNISDIYLGSKEVDILGRGETSIKNDTINLELNIKTDLASTVSKIPVVGFILFDKDSVSTSLSVEGKLTDPKVKSRLAEDIVVAPLNIVKRTLLYPYYLISDVNTSEIKSFDISEEE